VEYSITHNVDLPAFVQPCQFQFSLLLFKLSRKAKEIVISTELSNAAMTMDGNK